MSYLSGPELTSFKKAVISFWFRVPQASLDAAQAQGAADTEGTERLSGLVPLVVMGKEGTERTKSTFVGTSTPFTSTHTVNDCTQQITYTLEGPCIQGQLITHLEFWVTCTTFDIVQTYYTNTTSYSAEPGKPTDPTFIAVDGSGNLRINFESAKTGATVLPYSVTEYTPAYTTDSSRSDCNTISLNYPCIQGGGDITMTVITPILCVAIYPPGAEEAIIAAGTSGLPPEHGGTDVPASVTYGGLPGDMGTGAIGNGDFDIPPLAADQWHHVLISVDTTNGSASRGIAAGETSNMADRITATSLMYIAVDDVNYLTNANSPFPGTNRVYTLAAAVLANIGQAINDLTGAPEGPVPSFLLTDMSVPAATIGIPSGEKYVDRIHHVELAEFQMFTGTSVDTADVRTRRAFIDAQGKPVPANQKAGSGKTSGSTELLHRTPAVLLHGSGNWKTGKNTGSTSGQFHATGKIKAYKPDPSLHGPQSPAH